ncbi:MAG: purine-nucleoside phosphorylase [Peptococcaceae bacterium]|nr:purine-nucleoside phosphorylase [Peptococcaceae bacterium]
MLPEYIDDTVSFIRSKTAMQPIIGVVLGSGLGAFGEMLEEACIIPYDEVPHFAVSTAPGHKGRLIIGKMAGKTLLCMQGRFHYYEGYTMQQVTYPVRVMKALGIDTLILTNSSGGLNPDFQAGELMLITDHINNMGVNPLIGPNEDSFGTRFPDMTMAYSKELKQIARDAAIAEGVDLKEGVYVAFTGPSYETPAEIRMWQKLGASAVGMSTVPEAIVASHSRLKLLALSCVTNLAAGILDVPLTGEEVIEVANQTGKKFTGLLTEIVARI